MSRNLLPIKRLSNELLGQTVQLNKVYTYDPYAIGDVLHKERKKSLLSFGEHNIIKVGHAVAHLVEAPRYKPERLGFDFRWCHCNFSLT
jgi:hypothetical protein